MNKIVLASGSPRRKQLLELAKIEFEVIVRPIVESFPKEMSPSEAAIHIAKNKAEKVKNNLPRPAVIVSADTMVVLENNIIGKPKDRDDAIATLKKLSGNTHQVITGVCILNKEKVVTFYETTDVEFKELTLSQIEYYIDEFSPFDKAGSYAIQEWIGIIGIKSIKGDYYNVMGLPINKLFDILINL